MGEGMKFRIGFRGLLEVSVLGSSCREEFIFFLLRTVGRRQWWWHWSFFVWCFLLRLYFLFGVFTGCMRKRRDETNFYFFLFFERTKKTIFCLQTSYKMQHSAQGLGVGQVDPCGCWDGSFDLGMSLGPSFIPLTSPWTPLDHGFAYFIRLCSFTYTYVAHFTSFPLYYLLT